jgi:NTE family protein
MVNVFFRRLLEKRFAILAILSLVCPPVTAASMISDGTVTAPDASPTRLKKLGRHTKVGSLAGASAGSTNLDTIAALPPAGDPDVKLPPRVLPKMGRPTVVLALGGGGTRGAAHVGVLKVLIEAGIPIDGIVGTSMGSIVGGLYAAGVPLSTINEKLADASMMHAFMTVPLWVRIAAAPILLTPRLVGFHPYDGLYWGNKFRKYLAKMTPGSEGEIQELKIPFMAIAQDISDGHHYALTSGSLAYALQASSAVPVLRKPVQIGDHLYCDGGVVANVPVKEAKALGGDIVIAVNVDERVNKVPLDDFRKVGSVAKRLVVLQLAEIDAPQVALADVVIHPQVDGIGLISTKKADGMRAIAAGEEAAREALPQIKAKLAQIGQASASAKSSQ